RGRRDVPREVEGQAVDHRRRAPDPGRDRDRHQAGRPSHAQAPLIHPRPRDLSPNATRPEPSDTLDDPGRWGGTGPTGGCSPDALAAGVGTADRVANLVRGVGREHPDQYIDHVPDECPPQHRENQPDQSAEDGPEQLEPDDCQEGEYRETSDIANHLCRLPGVGWRTTRLRTQVYAAGHRKVSFRTVCHSQLTFWYSVAAPPGPRWLGRSVSSALG